MVKILFCKSLFDHIKLNAMKSLTKSDDEWEIPNWKVVGDKQTQNKDQIGHFIELDFPLFMYLPLLLSFLF